MVVFVEPEIRPYDVSDIKRDFPDWDVKVIHKRLWRKGTSNQLVLLSRDEAKVVDEKTGMFSLESENYHSLSNTGGMTFVKIKCKEGVFTGVALCSREDFFIKKAGRVFAIMDLARKVPVLASAMENFKENQLRDYDRR